ncbi:MAG: RNA polymerase sigma factor [Clostridia bacterium]|nr:RNA polymerase sigma factor [Clostridia bacterium]
MSQDIHLYVKQAIEGDRLALEKVMISIQDRIYNLALRMLWNPSDAEDTTQEILVKVITNLSKFRGESKFGTWVYRIACNHLINTNKRGLEHQGLSFEIFEQGIHEGFDTKQGIQVSEVDRNLLAEELKVSCTHAMLLCLEREQRIIYILSSMFGVKSNEGAEILDISPETYRKRLSRVREKMRNFMEQNCGLANPDKMCRCSRRVEVAIENNRINPEHLIFAKHPQAYQSLVEACKDEMEELDRVSAVLASNPYYLAPENVLQKIKNMISSEKYRILEA